MSEVNDQYARALEALDEIGSAGCIFELGNHHETIRTALQRADNVDGLLTALRNISKETYLNEWTLEFELTGSAVIARRSLAEFEKVE